MKKKSKISKTRQTKKQKTRKPKNSPLKAVKRKKEPLSANKKVVHFVAKGK
jgi:hypothetical protein